MTGYIDAVATLTPDSEIFGIPAIRIRNGFDFGRMRARVAAGCNDDNEINIAICALMEKWHGYERLIEGLAEYYRSGGDRKIVLHFIGGGTEVPAYRKLVEHYGLQNNAVFYGSRRWEEIPTIYDKCTLGASSLGIYKMGLDYICSLKTREYLAAGLPVIGAGQMDVLEYEELRPYVYAFPNDPTPIPAERLIAFHDRLYRGKDGESAGHMSGEIRAMAEKNLNMDNAMRGVIDWINET